MEQKGELIWFCFYVSALPILTNTIPLLSPSIQLSSLLCQNFYHRISYFKMISSQPLLFIFSSFRNSYCSSYLPNYHHCFALESSSTPSSAFIYQLFFLLLLLSFQVADTLKQSHSVLNSMLPVLFALSTV